MMYFFFPRHCFFYCFLLVPTTNQSINQSIKQSIDQAIDQSINQPSKKQTIRESDNRSNNQSINQPIIQSINQIKQPINRSENQTDQSDNRSISTPTCCALQVSVPDTELGGSGLRSPDPAGGGSLPPRNEELRKRLVLATCFGQVRGGGGLSRFYVTAAGFIRPLWCTAQSMGGFIRTGVRKHCLRSNFAPLLFPSRELDLSNACCLKSARNVLHLSAQHLSREAKLAEVLPR